MAAVLTADVGMPDTAAVAQEVDKGGAEVQKRVLSFLGVLLFKLSNLLCFDEFLVLLLPLFVVNF